MQQEKEHTVTSIPPTADSYQQAAAQRASSETQKWEPLAQRSSSCWLENKPIHSISLRNNKHTSQWQGCLYYWYCNPLLCPSKKNQVCFLSTTDPFEQWKPFFPFRCWSSSRGKSVSAGPKQRKGKQEGVDTLQHRPGSTININLHAQILSTSGRAGCDFHALNEACDSVGRLTAWHTYI